jgi:hypothetical protein
MVRTVEARQLHTSSTSIARSIISSGQALFAEPSAVGALTDQPVELRDNATISVETASGDACD